MRAVWVYGPALFLSGCGYVGDPLYPALNIPNPVIDLSAVERGEKLDIRFTIPPLTTEGLPVKQLGGIELRIGPNKSQAFNIGEWASAAAKVEIPVPDKPGAVQYALPVQPYIGQDVIVGVRAINSKRRASEWSNLVTLHVQPPLAAPAELTAQLAPHAVLLTWKASEPNFHIFRKAQDESQATQIGAATEPKYLDDKIQYGKIYEYWVRGLNGEAQSEYAGPVSVKAENRFPPSVPSGVSASAGLQTIELAWDRNTEPDFKSYRVYRTVGDAPFELVADVEIPGFSDNKIESGKRYRYAVSAIDQAGNESEKSAAVDVTAP